MSNLNPLFDRVLIKRVEDEKTTPGGIIIPDNAKEKTQLGAVISVGKGKVLNDGTIRPVQLKKGDTVLFGKFSGTDVKFDGAEYLILKEDEVLGVLES
jgi:chaperonin GroES